MIICPKCKEEIEDDSHYCDQCGQALLYCNRCGRVGIGRRCTNCGGLMVTPEEYQRGTTGQSSLSASNVSQGMMSMGVSQRYPSMGVSQRVPTAGVSQRFAAGPVTGVTSQRVNVAGPVPQGVPMLLLYNSSLNIRIQGMNGAVIGRRQGPYAQFFQQNMYVSGVHAQLKYNAGTGWCITDKHSSNGTKLNDRPLQPDVDMSLKNGDIVTIANINLQVSVNN